MNLMSLVFKPLLFPKPVVLKYLPALLRMSLPGIDPSDPMKSAVTLHLYSTILTWLPVRSSYTAHRKEVYPPPYLSLVDSSYVEYNPYSEEIAQVGHALFLVNYLKWDSFLLC